MNEPTNRSVPEAAVSKPGKPVRKESGPLVKVRARSHLAEDVDGELRRFAPGDEFELPASRAKAIGPLVEILK